MGLDFGQLRDLTREIVHRRGSGEDKLSVQSTYPLVSVARELIPTDEPMTAFVILLRLSTPLQPVIINQFHFLPRRSFAKYSNQKIAHAILVSFIFIWVFLFWLRLALSSLHTQFEDPLR
jgi:hypothetical protein